MTDLADLGLGRDVNAGENDIIGNLGCSIPDLASVKTSLHFFDRKAQ